MTQRGQANRGALLWQARQLSHFEVAVVVVVVAVLLVLAEFRLRPALVRAEQAHITATVANLRTALNLHVSMALVTGRMRDLAELDGGNPFRLMRGTGEKNEKKTKGTLFLGRYHGYPPRNYLGEFRGKDPAEVSVGQWYFERDTGFLIYRVEHARHMETSLPGPARIRYRVRLLYDDTDGNGRFEPDSDHYQGIVLKRMDRISWLNADLENNEFAHQRR